MNDERIVEEELGRLCDLPPPVLTRSGSQGFLCALLAMDLEPDAEVVLPVSICQTMVNAVLLAGATPLLADVDARLALREDDLPRCLGPRTRVVVAHHPFGHAISLDSIRAAIKTRAPGALLVEDCAQALGASHRGRSVGAEGDVVIFSFAAGKPLSAGIGGAVGARDRALDVQIRLACRVGACGFPDHEVLGLDSSLREDEARLVLTRLCGLSGALEARLSKALACANALAGVTPIVGWPPADDERANVFHRVIVALPTEGCEARYRRIVGRVGRALAPDARACVEEMLPVPPFASRALKSAYCRRRPQLLDPEGRSFPGWRAAARCYLALRTHEGVASDALARACVAIRAAIAEEFAS